MLKMLSKSKLLAVQLKHTQIYQSSTKSREIRKPPDCKFENDDKECLPNRRCVPQTTVCHTLPKQKCVITVQQPQRPRVSILPETRQKPFTKAPNSPEDSPWHKKMLPNEDNMSPAVKMAYRFLKFNAKALLAGGSMYVTAKYGVWGTSEQTADLYKQSHDAVTSLIDSNASQVVDVPDSREMVAACKHYWNKGVICTISSLVTLPSNIKKLSKDLYKQAVENLSPGVSKN